MSEEKPEPKFVKCLNCGNVWKTKAKRPQCSICKSTRTQEISEEEFLKLKDEFNVDQQDSTSESTSLNVDSTVDQTKSTVDQHKSTSTQHSTSGIQHDVESAPKFRDAEDVESILKEGENEQKAKAKTSARKSKKADEEKNGKSKAILLVIGFIAVLFFLFLSLARRGNEEMDEMDEPELDYGNYRGLSPFGC